MHRKGTFLIAGIFLAVALIVPPVILISQTSGLAGREIIPGDTPGHQTSGNVTDFFDLITADLQTVYIIVIVIEIVFVLLFVVALYYGINHPHPEH